MDKLRNRLAALLALILIIALLNLACFNVAFSDLSEGQPEYDYATSVPQSSVDIQAVSADYLPTVLAKIEGTPIASDQLPVSAVVQIVVRGTVDGVQQEWSGSGTIISPDGLILTNAHVAMGDRFYPAEQLLIMLTVAEDALPEAAFYAEVMQADEDLDIAVLRPSVDLQGNPVDRASLNLPFVSLGNSDDLHLGDDILILGYPGIGGETITLTRGEVSGFTSETGYGNRAYIKTSATIAGGNSGGLAVDDNNQLVGIPTEVGAGDDYGEVVDCRPLADTNRDGVINDYDTCVPTGGFINALRPVNLAIPLIDAALNGEVAYNAETYQEAQIAAGSQVVYQDDFSDTSTGWPVESDSEATYYYKDGRYWIEIKTSNLYMPISGGLDLMDVVLSLNSRVEASSSDGDFGLFCRQQDDDMYLFDISEDGYFAIILIQEDSWKTILGYSYSNLLSSLHEVNVQASCVGNLLTLAVNNVVLGQVSDDTLLSGDYGFFAGTFYNSGNIVSFDDLVVSQP